MGIEGSNATRRRFARPAFLVSVGVAALALALLLDRRSGDRTPAVDPDEAIQALSGSRRALPDTSQGLRCIRAGATREEVRRVMGEPDSIAFGDWLYGASSVTFGYGTVLDFSNAGGNLVLCP